VRTMLQGWQRYKNHPDLRIRERFTRESRDLASSLTGVVWAAQRWFRSDPVLRPKIAMVLKDLYREFGLKARVTGPLAGRYIRFMARREDSRLRRGWRYEPPTFCETTNP
jgi:hypothetical protein